MIDKILIIDDETIFCNALSYHFKKKGYNVDFYTSFCEFQDKKLNFLHFDIMLIDLNLNDIYGFELLKIILEINPNMKVIIVSAYLDESKIFEAKELGAIECAFKDSTLFEVLDKLIERI